MLVNVILKLNYGIHPTSEESVQFLVCICSAVALRWSLGAWLQVIKMKSQKLAGSLRHGNSASSLKELFALQS